VSAYPLARVILFAKDCDELVRFYTEVLGLERSGSPEDSADFVTLAGGGAQLCIHGLPARIAKTIAIEDPPRRRSETALKVAFYAEDVAKARADVVARGARMGEVTRFGALALCDGVDPEGNVFQISNRR
jgi:predicted enzyme related to lactoylglutathione lyase